MQSYQLYRLASNADSHRKQVTTHTVTGSRAEYHRQDEIGRGCGNQQDLRVHIRVKNTVADRDTTTCQQSKGQYAARHGTGHGKQQ